MIKISSVYDIKKFRILEKYMSFKIFLLGYICGVILLLIGVLFAFTSRGSYIVYIVSSILLPVLLHVFYKFIELDNLNRNPLLKQGISQIFTFDELGFELEQTSTYKLFKERYLYKDVYSIVKYKGYYFIYVNRSQAFVVGNNDYLIGSEEELDEIFKKYKEERFIIKRNSKKK